MKTGFLSLLSSKKSIAKKIDKRRAAMMARVVIDENLPAAEKAFLKQNQAYLGRYACNKRVKIEFKPLENDLFANTQMRVFRLVQDQEPPTYVESSGAFTSNKYTKIMGDWVTKKMQMGSDKAIDATANAKEKIQDILANIKASIEEVNQNPSKEKFVKIVGRMSWPP